MKKYWAFTLAEVLIALLIIGVIAAITVPTLLNYTQEQQFKSALKKNFTVISNAFNLSYGYDYDDFRDWTFERSDAFLNNTYDTLKKYLYIEKKCGHAVGCFEQPKAKNGNWATHSSVYGFGNSSPLNFILNDGTAVSLDFWYAQNVKTYMGVEKELLNESANLLIGIDVNGEKKPNVTGKDVFVFVLTNRGIVPAGIDNNSRNCENNSVNYNYDCTAKYLK